MTDTLIRDDGPIDPVCNRRPHEINEYAEQAAHEGISADEYVIREEGTYNPESKHFLCTGCYIKAGMPSSPSGWRCP